MKLSILIPTHNRPVLFTRCINSVMQQLTNDIEIIVNNDSQDITELSHQQITYYYEKFNNLSGIYKFLLGKATGEYVYFLEDDDYITSNFLKNLVLDADLIVGNYLPLYHVENQLSFAQLNQNAIFDDTTQYIQSINVEHLQLSQYVFKRNIIEDFAFPSDNNIYNDYNLVLHAVTRSKYIKSTNQVYYYQTTDGGDNLSFSNSTTTVPITRSLEFLTNYGLLKTTSPTTRS